ncbi:hypothetical protein [Streptomyces sp. NPDC047009]|uniref:hypothetical protein n=1 Tax=Streptomyces sp. NPDC047009 TaxID=3154496 RepID=UPI0033C1C77A
MPDSDRLYALASTYTSPRWDGAGPGLLIDNPVTAMRWYLSYEREENLAVTTRVSGDGGATWQPLPLATLWAQAHDYLANNDSVPGRNSPVQTTHLINAVVVETAGWLDHRMRYVTPDDPFPATRLGAPGLADWERGGVIFALVLGELPDQQVLAHLVARYTKPYPDGVKRLLSAARRTLKSLDAAQHGSATPTAELLQELEWLQQFTFGGAMGQLRESIQGVQRSLIDELARRLPDTPDPQWDADATLNLYRRLRTTLAADSTNSDADGDEQAPASPMPGYPVVLDDLAAAAAWRLQSPLAHRDARITMARLAEDEADAAELAATEPGQHRRAFYWDELAKMDARHALLMHGHTLRAAHEAVRPAVLNAGIEAHKALAPSYPADYPAIQSEFTARVDEAERQIHQVLDEQRQLTRDALERLTRRTNMRGSGDLRQLRPALLLHYGHHLSPFDDRAFERAQTRVDTARDRLHDLEPRYNSPHISLGSQHVTEEELREAKTTFDQAYKDLHALRRSWPVTMHAVNALESVRDLAPSPPDDTVARIERLAQKLTRPQPAAPAPPSGESARTTLQGHPQHQRPGVPPVTHGRPLR